MTFTNRQLELIVALSRAALSQSDFTVARELLDLGEMCQAELTKVNSVE